MDPWTQQLVAKQMIPRETKDVLNQLLGKSYGQLECVYDVRNRNSPLRDVPDSVWVSLILGNIANEKDFLQNLSRLTPIEWHQLVSVLKDALKDPDASETIESGGQCTTLPFHAVLKYLGEEKEKQIQKEQKIETGDYKILDLLPLHALPKQFNRGSIDKYFSEIPATEMFKSPFRKFLQTLGIPIIIGLTYAFAEFLLPLEWALFDILSQGKRGPRLSKETDLFALWETWKIRQESLGNEEVQLSDTAKRQVDLFLHWLLKNRCTPIQMNSALVQLGDSFRFYDDLMTVQDRLYLEGKGGIRYPIVLLDNQDNYVAHIYVYNNGGCEMRGIRTALTRVLVQGCSLASQKDKNIAFTLLASGVIPLCESLGLHEMQVAPVTGSPMEWLLRNRLQWNRYRKPLKDLKAILKSSYQVPNVTRQYF